MHKYAVELEEYLVECEEALSTGYAHQVLMDCKNGWFCVQLHNKRNAKPLCKEVANSPCHMTNNEHLAVLWHCDFADWAKELGALGLKLVLVQIWEHQKEAKRKFQVEERVEARLKKVWRQAELAAAKVVTDREAAAAKEVEREAKAVEKVVQAVVKAAEKEEEKVRKATEKAAKQAAAAENKVAAKAARAAKAAVAKAAKVQAPAKKRKLAASGGCAAKRARTEDVKESCPLSLLVEVRVVPHPRP